MKKPNDSLAEALAKLEKANGYLDHIGNVKAFKEKGKFRAEEALQEIIKILADRYRDLYKNP